MKKRIFAFLLALCACVQLVAAKAETMAFEPGTSVSFAKALKCGWDLGGSLDACNTALEMPDLWDRAWGHPSVTKDLIHSIRQKGFTSIGIPVTLYRRFDENTFKIDEAFLKRVKEVVDWAMDEGFYVLVDIHHDSQYWLNKWDGNTSSREYKCFVSLWTQFAKAFRDESDHLAFITINEPVFDSSVKRSVSDQQMLDTLNKAALDAIRSTGGNNRKRMVALPTIHMDVTEQECQALASFIKKLNDPYVVADVHYYAEWYFSVNFGVTMFEEKNGRANLSAKDDLERTFERLKRIFIQENIGVFFGEYGLLGNDVNHDVVQRGEKLKYIECMNYEARKNGMGLLVWDHGFIIDRQTNGWQDPVIGEMIQKSMTTRSATGIGLDTTYLRSSEQVVVSFVPNGTKFIGIEGLRAGVDYFYSQENNQVLVSTDYIKSKFPKQYGEFLDLKLTFDKGASWHQKIAYVGNVSASTTSGKYKITVPIAFNGADIRRIAQWQNGQTVGPWRDWYTYLRRGVSYKPDKEAGYVIFTESALGDISVKDGELTAVVEFFDGQKLYIVIEKNGIDFEVKKTFQMSASGLNISRNITLYAGEKTIPTQYYSPSGATLSGVSSNNDNILSVNKNGSLKISGNASNETCNATLRLAVADETKDFNVSVNIKQKPSLADLHVMTGGTGAIMTQNVDSHAKITWSIKDAKIASISDKGVVTGIEPGTTQATASITQFNRTDKFTCTITVVKDNTKPGYTGFKNAKGEEYVMNGPVYWYENGIRQGVYGDKKNVWDRSFGNYERGREIYDPVTDGWYWLDALYEGCVARSKEVWMPYIFQEEPPGSTDGKWVRYDIRGKMIKGWLHIDDRWYYYDTWKGAM